ncbi:MAG: DUF2726 domain-containing protein [bacterium]
MGNLTFFFVIIIIVAIIFYFFKDKILSYSDEDQDDYYSDKQYLYKKKEFLLNIPERKFFDELQRIIPDNYVVFPQIVLSSIVSVNSSKQKFWTYQNKINRKTIDFVIFERPYYKPVLAIEYDGKTHNYPNRIERDINVSKILDKSGIKNFHVRHQEYINFEEIKNKIEDILINKNY